MKAIFFLWIPVFCASIQAVDGGTPDATPGAFHAPTSPGTMQTNDDDCEFGGDGKGEACDTGEPGICANGRLECRDGELRCEREKGPEPEACDNGKDDDCDGLTDFFDFDCLSSICRDLDGDGWAVCSDRCDPLPGDRCGDCDDLRASIRPGAPEACNGADDDCDHRVDEDCDPGNRCLDADGDGWAVCAGGCEPHPGDQCGDCNDVDRNIGPDEPERCNGADDDCDGDQDEGNPGGGGSCGTGLPGACGQGRERCQGGDLVCEPEQGSLPEDCDNGVDDDCNGMTDVRDAVCAPGCEGRRDEDSDGDAVPDCVDNCPAQRNAAQDDYDTDGMGDACEVGAALCDVDLSGRVDGFDLARLARAFASRCGAGSYDRTSDLTRDCIVDGNDLSRLGTFFGQPSR